jgi:hypothetical protein
MLLYFLVFCEQSSKKTFLEFKDITDPQQRKPQSLHSVCAIFIRNRYILIQGYY